MSFGDNFDNYKMILYPTKFKDISKYEIDYSYEIAREVFKGRTSERIYVGREPYFKNANYSNAIIIKWSYLKDLFDIVNERRISMDDIEKTISTEAYYNTGNLWDISDRPTPFYKLNF